MSALVMRPPRVVCVDVCGTGLGNADGNVKPTSPAQLGAEGLGEPLDDGGVEDVHLVVGEGSVGRLEAEAIRAAFKEARKQR